MGAGGQPRPPVVVGRKGVQVTPQEQNLDDFCDRLAESLGFANKAQHGGSTYWKPTERQPWVGIIRRGETATVHFGSSGEMLLDFERLKMAAEPPLRARMSGSIPATVAYSLGSFDRSSNGQLVGALDRGGEYEYAEQIEYHGAAVIAG